MNPTLFAVTAALLLLFNLIAHLKRSAATSLLLIVFLVAGAIAATQSLVLLVLAGLLGIAGLALLLTRHGRRLALPVSLVVAVLVQVGNAIYPFEPTAYGWETMTKADRARLREEYPFETLSERLAGQRHSLPGLPGDSSFGSPNKSWQHLHGQEYNFGYNLRSTALQILHGDSVRKFAERPDFGPARMRVWPLPKDLTRGEDNLVTLTGKTFIELEDADYTPQGVTPSVTPSSEWLLTAHFASVYEFLNPADFGYFRSRDEVAGFRPHQFRRLPGYPRKGKEEIERFPPPLEDDPVRSVEEKPRTRWRLLKLELVGLLMHETPVVYVSEHLPSMKNAKELPTRSLDTFEKSTLPALERGEDIIPSRDGDTLRILGSIRAAKQCLKCHEVERGSLLGAFTYTLRKEGQP